MGENKKLWQLSFCWNCSQLKQKTAFVPAARDLANCQAPKKDHYGCCRR